MYIYLKSNIMFGIFKKWFIKRIATKITVAYLSNPNVNPQSAICSKTQLQNINLYIINVLRMGSNDRKKYIESIMNIRNESNTIKP